VLPNIAKLGEAALVEITFLRGHPFWPSFASILKSRRPGPVGMFLDLQRSHHRTAPTWFRGGQRFPTKRSEMRGATPTCARPEAGTVFRMFVGAADFMRLAAETWNKPQALIDADVTDDVGSMHASVSIRESTGRSDTNAQVGDNRTVETRPDHRDRWCPTRRCRTARCTGCCSRR